MFRLAANKKDVQAVYARLLAGKKMDLDKLRKEDGEHTHTA